MSIAKSLLAISLAAQGTLAQSLPIAGQQVAQARALLQSMHRAERAWGVFLAARLHSDDLNKLIVEEFRTAAPLRDATPYSAEHAFVAALFDRAIEAGISVPAPLVEPFEHSWTAPVLIMLARSEDREKSLLRISGDSANDEVWLAANNLLFEMKSPSWYSKTLSDLPLAHTFTVTDPGTGLGSAVGIGVGGGVGCGGLGLISMPRGFPPIGLFELSMTPQRGSTMLAHGPRDIYYDRTVVPTDKPTPFGGHSSTILHRARIKIGYVAKLGDVSVADIEQLWHRSTLIQYRGSEELTREMEQALNTQEKDIRSLLQRIKDRGLEPTPGTVLTVVPDITDLRENAAGRLPPVLPWQIAFN
jgi:hypothetical protein